MSVPEVGDTVPHVSTPSENKELVSSEAPTMAQLFHDSQSHDQPPHIYYVHKTLGFHWRTRMKKEVVRKMKGEVSHELQVNAPVRKARELIASLKLAKLVMTKLPNLIEKTEAHGLHPIFPSGKILCLPTGFLFVSYSIHFPHQHHACH